MQLALKTLEDTNISRNGLNWVLLKELIDS